MQTQPVRPRITTAGRKVSTARGKTFPVKFRVLELAGTLRATYPNASDEPGVVVFAFLVPRIVIANRFRRIRVILTAARTLPGVIVRGAGLVELSVNCEKNASMRKQKNLTGTSAN